MALAPPRDYARGEILPHYEIDVGARHTANLASNFRLLIASSTSLQVPAASTNDEAAVISIANLRRYVETTLTASHPGGSAGTYDVYVTCANDTISGTPSPNTDNTAYGLGLVVRAAASPPTGVDQYRKVGTCEWSGTAITQVNQRVGDTQPYQPLAPASTIDGETPLRVFGSSSSQSAALVRAFKNSGGAELLTLAPAGLLTLPVTGSGAGLSLGASAVGLYESASGHLALRASTVLDLSPAGATDASTGTQAGDKIALYGSSSGFGLGVQSTRLVAYVPSGAALAVRQTSGSGQRSSGSDAITLSAAGVAAVGNGLFSAPSLTFLSDPDTGLYRSGANVISVSAGGVDQMDVGMGSVSVFGSLGIVPQSVAVGLVIGTLVPNPVSGNGVAGPDAIQAGAAPGGNTTGTTGQTAGKGGGLRLTAGDGGTAPSGSTNGAGGDISLQPGGAGAGAGSAGVVGHLILGKSTTRLSFFDATGGASSTKVTVTGSRGANAALASLLTALASYGLITDSST